MEEIVEKISRLRMGTEELLRDIREAVEEVASDEEFEVLKDTEGDLKKVFRILDHLDFILREEAVSHG